MIIIYGKNNISAAVIADSISPDGVRMVTMELEYPRFIHSEVMTHRALSKNAASSRAIPIKSMHDAIRAKTATPVHWGKNQPGMQAKEEVDTDTMTEVVSAWISARDSMLAHSRFLSDRGLHKQIANRITEPFQMMKTVISGTEWDNLFALRYHPDAQPEFYELARCMKEVLDASKPDELVEGMWHMPYVNWRYGQERPGNTQIFYDSDGTEISTEVALQVSGSCCAQVSYRKNDDSVDKAKDIFQRLIHSRPMHASPVEHQATPIVNARTETGDWKPGITSMDRAGGFWSGNLRGWLQHRKLIELD